MGSRLLTRETLEAAAAADQERLSGALARYGIGGVATAYLVGGRGVREAVTRGGGDAVLPAWRRAYIHSKRLPTSCFLSAQGERILILLWHSVAVAYGYVAFNESRKREAMEGMECALQVIQNLEPDSGSHLNDVCARGYPVLDPLPGQISEAEEVSRRRNRAVLPLGTSCAGLR